MKIILAGAYAIGTHLARLLSRNNHDIVLMDENEERLDGLGSDVDVLTYHASPTSIKALKEVGTSHANLFIAVTPDENKNMASCILAAGLGAKKTVAKVDNYEFTAPELKEHLNRVGITSIVFPEQLAARDITNGLKMSWVRQRWDVHDGALVMLGIKLRESCEILNRPLKEISGPDDPYHIVAIKRGDDTIIPRGEDELKLFMGGGSTAVRACLTMPEYMNVKLIESNEKRCEVLNEVLDTDQTMVINGDGRDLQLLMEEGIKNTQAFVALTENAETNILACLTAKRMGVRKTVAMVENIDYVSMAESLDIGTIVNKKAMAASHIYQMMLDADVANIRFLMTANADIAEFVAQAGSKVTRKKVFELGLPKGATIGGLVRNGDGMLVSGGTQIIAGDIVVVFCHNMNIAKIEKFFT